jgi:hypothetical protein
MLWLSWNSLQPSILRQNDAILTSVFGIRRDPGIQIRTAISPLFLHCSVVFFYRKNPASG